MTGGDYRSSTVTTRTDTLLTWGETTAANELAMLLRTDDTVIRDAHYRAAVTGEVYNKGGRKGYSSTL